MASASGGISGFDPAEITVDSSGFVNPLNSGSFSVVRAGNNLDLVYSVPEPSTLALLGVAGLGLLGMAWRRRVTQRAIRLPLHQAEPEDDGSAILPLPACWAEPVRRVA